MRFEVFYRGVAAEERVRRVSEALAVVGMSHRSMHYPGQLSGGQQQRAAVVRAVVGEPALLLADEPTGNLDSRSGEDVMRLLGDLHQAGATVCVVTHDEKLVRQATRRVLLGDGRVCSSAGDR